jgi:hypothetical protein
MIIMSTALTWIFYQLTVTAHNLKEGHESFAEALCASACIACAGWSVNTVFGWFGMALFEV